MMLKFGALSDSAMQFEHRQSASVDAQQPAFETR
jgi:hypothetical protein